MGYVTTLTYEYKTNRTRTENFRIEGFFPAVSPHKASDPWLADGLQDCYQQYCGGFKALNYGDDNRPSNQ